MQTRRARLPICRPVQLIGVSRHEALHRQVEPRRVDARAASRWQADVKDLRVPRGQTPDRPCNRGCAPRDAMMRKANSDKRMRREQPQKGADEHCFRNPLSSCPSFFW